LPLELLSGGCGCGCSRRELISGVVTAPAGLVGAARVTALHFAPSTVKRCQVAVSLYLHKLPSTPNRAAVVWWHDRTICV